MLDLPSCLHSLLHSRGGGEGEQILFLYHLTAALWPRSCSPALYLKLPILIPLRLVAISAVVLLAPLSFSSLLCWLALQAFFGHPSSVSNIRPGWPNFILYWMHPVWIHTHTLKLGTWDISMYMPTLPHLPAPLQLLETNASSTSWWLTCKQRPVHAATTGCFNVKWSWNQTDTGRTNVSRQLMPATFHRKARKMSFSIEFIVCSSQMSLTTPLVCQTKTWSQTQLSICIFNTFTHTFQALKII